MTPEDIAIGRLLVWTYYTTHMIIDAAVEGLADDREDVEMWSLNTLRKFGKLRREHHQGKMDDYAKMQAYIHHLEVLAGIVQ